ncbi:ATP-dependent DNA helicase [Metamycoplasma canadense]|nr:AAA family ATPase [Metamycoplasma canadense]
MEQENSIVIGKFKKIIWQSGDLETLIVSFSVIKNDPKNPVFVNSFNTVSVIFRNKSFDKFNFSVSEKKYELSLIKNISKKYKNSYLFDNNYPFKEIEVINETEEDKLGYLIRVLKLPIFKNLIDSKISLLVSELKENLFIKILEDKNKIAKKFEIEENKWNDFLTIVKENILLIQDISNLFKINVSHDFYKQILKNFNSFDEFINEYKDNVYQYYFDAEEDKKVRLQDLDRIAEIYSTESLKFKNSAHLYSLIEEYCFSSGNTRIKRKNLYEILSVYKYEKSFLKDIESFEKEKNILLEKMLLIELNYDDEIYYSTRDILYMENYVVKKLFYFKKIKTTNTIPFSPSMIFDDDQIKAIKTSLDSNLVLITGNPGTGKTLITAEIIKHLLKKYTPNDIAVLTPTGRATININNKQEEVKAQTIHSILQWDPENNKFYVNEKNTISIECLIIDEFSMVSLDIFYHLLKGISRKSLKKIILVGDKDQLPAIGCGYLINDFIETKIFEPVFLNKIYRQSENFEIVKDALKVNQGILPDFNGEKSRLVECESEDLKDNLLIEIEKLLKKGYDKKDIAILSPIYKYETGIDNLNFFLTNYFREKEKNPIFKYREHTFSLNDKIINLVNDSKLKVFNGEIGYINDIILGKSNSKEETKIANISVDFENGAKTTKYSRSEFLENTKLAYCTSVHKYQGSECKAVIVVLFSEAKKLLSKKLIYTAMTRAKQYSVIIGEKQALLYGIQNDGDSKRITNIDYLWKKLK